MVGDINEPLVINFTEEDITMMFDSFRNNHSVEASQTKVFSWVVDGISLNIMVGEDE